MKQMTPAAVERAMKLQDVMLRAMAKRITWYQAAEILGLSGRQMLRWQTRFKHEGYEGLFDRRRGTPSPKRVPLETVETVLRLYQEQYFDFNVRHFHEKLGSEHGIKLSYTWVKAALQGAGLVKARKHRGKHRKRRPRRRRRIPQKAIDKYAKTVLEWSKPPCRPRKPLVVTDLDSKP